MTTSLLCKLKFMHLETCVKSCIYLTTYFGAVFSETLKEMRSFETEVLYKVSEWSDTTRDRGDKFDQPKNGYEWTFADVCEVEEFNRDKLDSNGDFVLTAEGAREQELVSRCATWGLLDVVWDSATKSYLIDDGQLYSTQDALLAKLQTGRGDEYRYAETDYHNWNATLSGLSPADFT